MMKVVEHTFENGLKLLVREDRSAPVASFWLFYRVGAADERPGITGISHYLEHMVFKGTERFKKGDIPNLVRGNGGVLNGQTSFDYTLYFETLPSDRIEVALQIESDRMVNCLIDPREVELERTVVLSELEGAENDPLFHLHITVQSIAYQVHPYRWPVIGWRCDLERITRDDLWQYYRRFYVPNNAVAVIAGDIDPGRAIELVGRYFGDLPRGEEPERARPPEPPQMGERRVKLHKRSNLAHVLIAYHIPEASHPDIYPLLVLESAMNGRSGRLYKALVEKELATTAWASVRMLREPGLILFGATAKEGVPIERVEEALLKEIEGIREGLSEAELERAKNLRESGFLLSMDSVSSQARMIGFYEMVSSYKQLEEYLDKLKEVRAEDVARVAGRYLTERNRTVGWLVPEGGASGAVSGGAGPEIASWSGGDGEPAREVLENGMVVIAKRNPALPIVQVRGAIKLGGRAEPPELGGISEFTAQLLMRGTENRSAIRIAEEIESIGSSVNIWGGIDSVGFGLSSTSRNFEKTLEILADCLLNPTFPEEEVEKIRSLDLSRLKREMDIPGNVAERLLYKLIYPEGHPYRYIPGYDEETLTRMRREDLVSFHSRFYRPDMTVIAVVGDVDPREAIDAVARAFEGWRAEGEPHDPTIPPVDFAESGRHEIPMPDKSQTDILLGHKGIKRNIPDYHAFSVLNEILSGFGGRLFTAVRDEQGLVYGVRSWYVAGLGEGPFGVGLGTNPKNVGKALRIIERELKRIKEEPVSDEELDRAKNALRGRFILSMETNWGVAHKLAMAEFFGLGLDYIRKAPELIAAVGREDVIEAARKYIHPEKLITVIAGAVGG